MIHTISEAREIILAKKPPPKEEKVPLGHALHRVLAEDVIVDRDVPPVPLSRRDGFVLRAQDTHSPPSFLPVVGTITAGKEGRPGVEKGEAMRIMTGAVIPSGANAVVEWEQVTVQGEGIVVPHPVKEGAHITAKGKELKKGEGLLKKGERINPLMLGILASLGWSEVPVYQRPRTGILTTGDELVELGSHPSPGERVNSNAYLLAGLVKKTGALPVLMGTCGDKEEELEDGIERGLEGGLLLTTGGVGEGDHDLTTAVWKRLGITFQLFTVQARPGKRVLFGLWGERPLFALPGSPGALLVLFMELVQPFLYALQGEVDRGYLTASLTHPVVNRGEEVLYLPGRLQEKRGRISIQPLTNQSYSSSAVEAQVLFLVPEKTAVKKGDTVQYRLLQ